MHVAQEGLISQEGSQEPDDTTIDSATITVLPPASLGGTNVPSPISYVPVQPGKHPFAQTTGFRWPGIPRRVSPYYLRGSCAGYRETRCRGLRHRIIRRLNHPHVTSRVWPVSQSTPRL